MTLPCCRCPNEQMPYGCGCNCHAYAAAELVDEVGPGVRRKGGFIVKGLSDGAEAVAASADDVTGRQETTDPRCTSCALEIPHTVAVHARRLGGGSAQRR